MDSANSILALAAQAAAPAQGSGGIPIYYLIGIIAVLYIFLIHLPMKRERAKASQMDQSLVRGARVVTAGGIHGRVESVDKEGNAVNVTVAPKIVLKFNRSSIVSVSSGEGKSEKEETPAS